MKFLRRLFGKKESAFERNEDRFAHTIISALHERDANIQVEYDSERFELVHVDDGARGQRMFLHNSFAESGRLLDEEKGPHLKRIIDFIIESRSQRPRGDAALDQLLPVVRPRADTIGFAAIDAPSFMYNNSSRVFCDHMMIMLALDSETSIAILNDESLADLGVPFNDALGIAIGHLSERHGHTFAQLDEGVFVTTCGDHYDASRVLMPSLF